MINQLDLGRALGQGVVVGNAMQRADQERQLQNVFAQHGAGIMQGNPQALNALAAIDPVQAFGIQRQVQADDRARAAEGRDERLFNAQMQKYDREAAEYVRAQGAEKALAETEATRRAIAGASAFVQRGDEAGYNAYLQQNGIDPAEYPMGQFDAIARSLMGFSDAIEAYAKGMEPEKPKYGFNNGQYYDENNPAAGAQPIPGFEQEPADEYERYVADEIKAGREPLSRIDYKRAGQKSTRLTTSPDGGVTFEEGFGDAPPALTVDAAKNTGFLIRTKEANDILSKFDTQGTDFWQGMANDKGGRVGNYLLTPEYQQFDQARRDFVNAILRRESGAVISDEEFANANRQYFPSPGDSPQVIEQKRRNRETAIEGLRVGSGDGAAYVEQKATGAAPAASSQEPGDQFALPPRLQAVYEKYGAPTGR